MRQRFLLLLVSLALASTVWAKPETFVAAKLLTSETTFGSGRWVVEPSGQAFQIEGRGRITGSKGQAGRLPLDDNSFVTNRLYAYARADELLLWYEVSDVDSAGGTLVCFDINTLRLRWEVNIPSFNIGQPLLDHDVVYLTGYGTVAKVGLVRGNLLWMVKDLGQEQGETITSFQRPEFKGNLVVLNADARTNDKVGLKGEVAEPGRVELERRTGKVVLVRPTTYRR